MPENRTVSELPDALKQRWSVLGGCCNRDRPDGAQKNYMFPQLSLSAERVLSNGYDWQYFSGPIEIKVTGPVELYFIDNVKSTVAGIW
jgi:hypothetical protein